MSTRELAYSIFEQLTDEELEGFVALFRRIHPPKEENIDRKKRDEAFNTLESLRKNVPDFDEKKALAEYRKEKFGV